MASLQDLIKLAESDNGKFFVMDETGEVKLVIMGADEYQKVLLGRLTKQVADTELINQEIIKAQLQDSTEPAPVITIKPARLDMRSEVIDPSFDFDSPQTPDEFEV